MRAMCLTSLTWFAPGVHLDRLSIAVVGEGARRRLEQTEAAAEADGGLDRRPQPLRVPRREQELEGEYGVEHLEVRRVAARRQEDLADEERVAGRLAERAQAADRLGAVARVDVLERRDLRPLRQRKRRR